MSLQTIPPRRPSPIWSLLRFVHDRNPFYLLSALSMFVGFRVVLAALHAAPGDWRPLVQLIVTVQAYEAVIVALALYLIVRRGLHRDGWILLGIQSLFLADLTNLNAELFTAVPKLGCVVSGGCLLLALAQVAVVARVLRLRVTTGTAVYLAVQLAVLLALPGAFRLMRSTSAAVSPMQIYAAWWAVGGLLAVGAMAVRRSRENDGHAFATLPVRLYVLVPLLSLLVHLATENRVYWVHFESANFAPVLLAVVVGLNRGRRDPAQLRWSLAVLALAVWLSIVPHEDQLAMSTRWLGVAISPLRLTLLASAVAAAALAVRHRSWATGLTVAGCGLVATLGASWPEIVRRLTAMAEWAWDLAVRLVPQTMLEWGYAAIAAAFALLAVGAAVSLRPASGGERNVESIPVETP